MVQSLTVGVAPIVVVIASVCTFTLHMAMGHDLTAAEVLTYGKHARSSLFVLFFPLYNHMKPLKTRTNVVQPSEQLFIYLRPAFRLSLWSPSSTP